MAEVLINLRMLAGVLFFALADLVLGAVWVLIIVGIIFAVIRGSRNAD